MPDFHKLSGESPPISPLPYIPNPQHPRKVTPKSVHGALIYILLRMHFLTQLMFRGFIPHSTRD